MNMITNGSGTGVDPWLLNTPTLASEFQARRDPAKVELVVQVASTRLAYRLHCIEDLSAMLQARGD